MGAQGEPRCDGKGAPTPPHRRMARLPAWPLAGGTGSKRPARDEAGSQRPARGTKASNPGSCGPVSPEHLPCSLIMRWERPWRRRRGEERRGTGEGKEKRKKTKLESQMEAHRLLVPEQEWQGHPHMLRSMQRALRHRAGCRGPSSSRTVFCLLNLQATSPLIYAKGRI